MLVQVLCSMCTASLSILYIRYGCKHPIENIKAYWLFLCIFGTCIPIFGPIISCITVFYITRNIKSYSTENIRVLAEDSFNKKIPILTPSLGEGWAYTRLMRANFNENERKKALISVNRRVHRDAIFIFKHLVSDPVEEIRITAFSLLENNQTEIHQKIHQLTQFFDQEQSPQLRAKMAKNIAYQYWELIYLHLSEKELRNLILDKCLHFTTIAQAIFPEDPMLVVLRAQIFFQQQDIPASIQAFQKARELHAPDSKTLPYLAELAYTQGDFVSVKKYLSLNPYLSISPKLNSLIQFWLKNDPIKSNCT